ncbi:endonuclease MutS2 [bacterium]|nr:MAG: endonuclease MutS2 [bacterium]
MDRAISQTRTIYGAEELHGQVPEINASQVEFMHTLTREWMSLLQVDDAIPIDSLPDIRPSLQRARIIDAIVSPKDLLAIAQTCSTFRKVRLFIDRRKEMMPLSFSILERLLGLKNIEDSIFVAIDEQGEVKDSASPELRRIRSSLNGKRSQIRASLQRFMRQAQKDGASVDEGITLRAGRMVIPIKAEYKRQFAGFVHDVSSTGQTVYFEPAETLHLNNDIRQLESDEAREIERILREITAKVRPHTIDIENNLLLLAQADVWQAKARISNAYQGTLASVAKHDEIKLKDARNPNLLLKHEWKKNEVVPLDVELMSSEKLLMITGPNAGGKSVAMKTIGLCVLLNQTGFAIPAKESAVLPVFDGLFIDLGDDQSVENDLSTFSSRLVYIRETEKQLTHAPLILVDEAGAGTDPDEGSSLYQSFFERLLERNARILVTTHHGRLKVFAHDNPHAVNGSMEFDQVALQPTYRFQKGIPGSSYAFEIAGRLNLALPLIQRARHLLGKKNDTMELLINDLEKEHQTVREIRDQLLFKEVELNKLKTEYEERNKTIREQREKLKLDAVQEARSIISEANKQVERLVEQIRKNQADKESIKEARSGLEQLKKEVSKRIKKSTESGVALTFETPVVGDYVSIVSSGNVGQVLDIQGKRVTVDINGLRVVAKLNELTKTDKPVESKKKKKQIVVVDSGDDMPDLRASSIRLDVRGKRVEEVDSDLIPFIDKAHYSGLSEVEIIHGKGTGALRSYIRDRLKVDQRIAKMEDAGWENGGPGCTIVYFKKR